ncbi:MAG: sigma-70 family RNA polymerase sigma factor [Clostridia bacterium]|nr:sigma-70 family RNA polymerase sigma factor [Clostridia bacterium]
MKPKVDEVYKKYANNVFSAAFCICKSKADAEDVTQDAFIKYCSHKKEFADENHIKAWLLRTAINRAKDIKASFWQRNRVSLEEYMAELEFEEPKDEQLFKAVMALPQKYRTAIHLYYYEDYAVKEIADLLKASVGTVKSQLSRGRTLLKNTVEDWKDDE